jgi:hypothetical protein
MEPDLQTHFAIEKQCRDIDECANVEELRGLCRLLAQGIAWQQAFAAHLLQSTPP